MPVNVEFALLTLAAYLLGSVPVAYLVAKYSTGVDLRQFGSGNLGASNLLKLTSKRKAIPVILFDLLKGVVLVIVAHSIGLDITQQVVIGIAAIIGHNWSAFLHFHGGRGVLTTIGVGSILPLINGIPAWEMVVFAIIAISGVLCGYTPVGITIGLISLPLFSWQLGDPLPIVIGYVVMLVLLIIRRLAVRRSVLAGSISTDELMLNRLFYDRDIADRETWINRQTDDSLNGGQG